VELDLDTFLVAVYVTVDELYQASLAEHKPTRRGKRAELSDSEVLTLAILAQWQGRRSEAAFLRHALGHWRGYFPRLLSQADFNRRARDVGGALCALGPLIAQRLAAALPAGPRYAVLDGVPVPLARRCRGDRPKLFGAEAAVGRGGSDDDWHYGVCLLLCVDQAGSITGFVAGPANTGERWLADALLRWRVDPAASTPTAAQLAPRLGKPKEKGGERAGPTGPVGPWLGAGDQAPVATWPTWASPGSTGSATGRPTTTLWSSPSATSGTSSACRTPPPPSAATPASARWSRRSTVAWTASSA